MCPACISTAAIAVAAGATSAGGILALVARKLYLLRRALGQPQLPGSQLNPPG